MKEATQKALNEMMEAIKGVNALSYFGKNDAGEPMHHYNSKTVNALADAYEKEKETKTIYYTFFFKEQSWPQEQIDEWLKRAGLK